jgi:beta-lactam-binding protein with PASTA domain
VETVDARRRYIPLLVFAAVVALLFWWASDALAKQFAEQGDGVVVEDVEVPFLGGKTLDQAQGIVEGLNLEYEYVYAPNEVVPVGTVSAQRPLAGTKLIEGSLVLLVISEGPAQFVVPDVAGQQWQDAANVITAANLTATPKAEFNETVRIGEVIETRPSPGKALPAGSPVVVVVSGGKTPRLVPKIEGLPIEQGMNQLGLAGLGIGQIVREYTGAPEGTVLRTDPSAGALLGRDQPVTLVVAGPEPTVEVPSVEGLREEDALARFDEAGIEAVVQPWQVEPGAPEVGRVVRQGTLPAAKIPPGSKVELLVGVAPAVPTTQAPSTGQSSPPATVSTTVTTVTTVPEPEPQPAGTSGPVGG